MDSKHRIEVPLRSGGKKMRKRRELDALIARSITKRSPSARKGAGGSSGATHSQDKLLSGSTDEAEDYVWSNVEASGRRQSRKYNYFRMCGPILFIIASALLVGIMYWLYFDLRQQIYDYRQKIEEVSATSKNLPDTLQKWHETSSYLTRNQSTIFSKISDIQSSIESLRIDLSNLEKSVSAQQNYAKDEKLVADFGAKIEAVATDVEIIKEHYNSYVNDQKKIRAEINQIKTNLTSLTQTWQKPSSENYSAEFDALKSTIMGNVKVLSAGISLVNDTMYQKDIMLHDELVLHKSKLDDLLDRSENITSHVTTIRNSWPEYRQQLINMESSNKQLKEEVTTTRNLYENLKNDLETLTNFCKNKTVDTNDYTNKDFKIPPTPLSETAISNGYLNNVTYTTNATQKPN